MPLSNRKETRDTLMAEQAERAILEEEKRLFAVDVNKTPPTSKVFSTTKGGHMISAGVGENIKNKGISLFLIDDYCRRAEDDLSKKARDNTSSWFDSVYPKCFASNASVAIIESRLHEDDLSGRLLRLSDSRGEEIIV